MSLISALHLLALLVSMLLGAFVYLTNPRRTTNQLFLLLSCLLSLWLIFLARAFIALDVDTIAVCVRGCLASAALIPLAFDWMRVSIARPKDGLLRVMRHSFAWLVISLVAVAAVTSPFAVTGATYPAHDAGASAGIPEPIYGPLFAPYGVFYVCSLGLLLYRLIRGVKQAHGVQRTELQFILLGSGVSLFIGVAVGVVTPIVAGNSQSVQFFPISVIMLYAVIAYGIATRRIMDVAYFLRLMAAYALVTVYLVLLYAGVWWGLDRLMAWMHLPDSHIPHLVAALAAAFSLAPMHGRMQRVASRLFVHFAPIDVPAVVESANRVLYSLGTVDRVLAEFSRILSQAVGTDTVVILLADDALLVQRHPHPDGGEPLTLPRNGDLPRLLVETGTPLVPDIARRFRTNPGLAQAFETMDALHMAAAVGLATTGTLEGIVLVGPRLSGHIYGAPEQQALQLLCNQLAIALNNARLYTQVQDGKIYNDILVDSLAGGVIVAGTDGTITVFNREAQRITGLEAPRVRGQPVSALPEPLSRLLWMTFEQSTTKRDQELTLRRPNGEETPVSVSSAIFYGHAGRTLGAFVVMNDLTNVKRLEQQVRRSDRLASLGTLAAGMAHEIKNPLVSIKTFTQLLPERYDDSDFRDTFFSLVGNEVKRIDSIVNQLLRFSRPAKPNLANTSLHDILTNTLNLMTQQMRQKNVRLISHPDAPHDRILADADQLSQAFINFVLNAVESMPHGGTLTVLTNLSSIQRPPAGGAVTAIHVSIADTGEGIASEHVAHIFDPFFTTKSQGTGLGLSVAHGIITEHGGAIDVMSEVGRGTTFHLFFPLVQPEHMP